MCRQNTTYFSTALYNNPFSNTYTNLLMQMSKTIKTRMGLLIIDDLFLEDRIHISLGKADKMFQNPSSFENGFLRLSLL
jgi:hypothetical protein